MKKQSLILATAVAATLASSMSMAVDIEANLGVVRAYARRYQLFYGMGTLIN